MNPGAGLDEDLLLFPAEDAHPDCLQKDDTSYW